MAPSPTELLLLAASALAALTPDYCSSADQLLKDEQLERQLMMSQGRSASTLRSYSPPPKVSAVLAGLTSGADSAIKVNDQPLLMSLRQNRSLTDTK